MGRLLSMLASSQTMSMVNSPIDKGTHEQRASLPMCIVLSILLYPIHMLSNPPSNLIHYNLVVSNVPQVFFPGEYIHHGFSFKCSLSVKLI